MFQIFFYKDKEITGTFDVKMFKDKSCEGEGELIHSKLYQKGFPSADWELFINLVTDAYENL